jgi:predicted RNase H-like nuclease (RuvC/YqgF family)
MSENGAGSTGEKTYSQKEIDGERARVQAAQQQAQEAQDRVSDLEKQLGTMKTEIDGFKDKAAAGDPKAVEERVKQARADAEADLRKSYGKQLDDNKTVIENQSKELNRFRVVNVGLQKATGKFLDGAMPHVERHIEENGRFIDGRIVVMGKDGKPRMSPADPRTEMSLDELLDEFATANPFMVPPSTQRGTDDGKRKAGAAPNESVKPPPSGFEGWDVTARQKWMSENPESAKHYMRSRGFNI